MAPNRQIVFNQRVLSRDFRTRLLFERDFDNVEAEKADRLSDPNRLVFPNKKIYEIFVYLSSD